MNVRTDHNWLTGIITCGTPDCGFQLKKQIVMSHLFHNCPKCNSPFFKKEEQLKIFLIEAMVVLGFAEAVPKGTPGAMSMGVYRAPGTTFENNSTVDSAIKQLEGEIKDHLNQQALLTHYKGPEGEC